MKRLELRLAFAWERHFASRTAVSAVLLLRQRGRMAYPAGWARAYVPTCIPERPDLSQLGSSVLSFRHGTCRPSENRRKATRLIIPWRAERSLVWEVTVTDILANSYLPRTSRTAGAAAEMAADRKEAKYTSFAIVHHFVPLDLETMGPVCSDGLAFLLSSVKNLSTVSGDARETSYLFQRLALMIQRFNAVAFRGTFNTLDPGDE